MQGGHDVCLVAALRNFTGPVGPGDLQARHVLGGDLLQWRMPSAGRRASPMAPVPTRRSTDSIARNGRGCAVSRLDRLRLQCGVERRAQRRCDQASQHIGRAPGYRTLATSKDGHQHEQWERKGGQRKEARKQRPERKPGVPNRPDDRSCKNCQIDRRGQRSPQHGEDACGDEADAGQREIPGAAEGDETNPTHEHEEPEGHDYQAERDQRDAPEPKVFRLGTAWGGGIF
jgi:hypothetical protein